MVPWLSILLLAASQPGLAAPTAKSPYKPTHKIDLHIAGPLAMVEVWRSLDPAPRRIGNRQQESPLDLSLPEGAALLDWEVLEHGERARLSQQSEGQVNAGLAAVLKMRQLSPAAAATEEDIQYRIHVTPLTEGTHPVLHYRFAAPIRCAQGKLVLRMPESLEDNPVPAEVTVTLEATAQGFALAQASLAGKPADIRPGSRGLVLRGLSPPHAAWEVTWGYRQTLPGFPGQALVAAGPVSVDDQGRRRHGLAKLAEICIAQDAATAPPGHGVPDPASVVLLVDRSRSVGQGGLSEERVVGRALLEALPPSVPFNAILFGESATPLFPLARLATREALDAFSAAVDPNRMERTTDVAKALAQARQAYVPSEAPPWIVIVTDGALPAGQTAQRMQEALAGKPGAEMAKMPPRVRVLVLLVRQRGDDPVSEAALAEYARLVSRFGGLVRDVPPGDASETARAVIAAMHRGGDWFGLRIDDTSVAEVLGPGQGRSRVLAPGGRGGDRAQALLHARGIAPPHDAIATIERKLPALRVKAEWLEPLVRSAAAAGRPRAWAGSTSSVAVAVLPASPAAKKPADEIVRGRIDETVLRNALSLAFMPRARACYVSRRVASANDAYLRGRVRLELTIDRGELAGVVVRKSTLDSPDIEACLRNAAWAVDYPRAEHRDALTVANLNLVFRPHTSEERQPDASALDREIELVLGPVTLGTDFKDLLEDAPAEKAAAP